MTKAGRKPKTDPGTWSLAARLGLELSRNPGPGVEAKPCTRCLQRVLWARRPPEDGGGWHPPLAFAGYSNTIVSGVVYRIPIYDLHRCDSAHLTAAAALREKERRDRLQEAEERRARREQAQAASREYQEYRQALAGQIATIEAAAIELDCPRCPAVAGEKCLNLTKLRRHLNEETLHPHPARINALFLSRPELRPKLIRPPVLDVKQDREPTHPGPTTEAASAQ